MAKGISVIGSGIRAAQCALTLADMGIDVALITPSQSLQLDDANNPAKPSHELLHVWPLLLRAASHPRIKIYTNTRVKSVTGTPGDFIIKALKAPRYVKEDLCTGCGKCEEECSVKTQIQINGHKMSIGAIHSPILGAKSVPSAYYIEKQGISPCRAGCPLGINVQGFIALLGKGKIDKALELINEVAPMAGILGRLCTHPCESKCSRGEVDSPVFIQSLHRYIADNSPGGIAYKRKAPARSRKEKIAIIGSGPAGLAAAWELARRGYSPTIFESHAVVGGMLATGIPRYRLPREIREREVEAIKALGVDIKTGVTIGEDVTYADLLDRGYEAFFLGIGAQHNNKLNIPGEDLNGVLDCISLLFSLNLNMGASVGSNVIVIGGGNSAIDSAITTKRVSKGGVRVLCLTEAMTAVKEDVDEAINEGVVIDYNVSVLEIMGEGGDVTGVRCQKVRNVRFEPGGKITMEYIPGTEFDLKADHVVVAIGQKPDSAALNIKNLRVGRNATIHVDPLTQETNIKGIFAGGDAVTGSNNVVSAVAAGLRAAESIDRYIKGHSLRKGRVIEPPVPVKVNIEERKVSPYKRARMPVIPISRRKGHYEEINLGLPEDLAKREAGRCLNCAICCECMECEEVCELNAVFHEDTPRNIDVETDSIINFVSSNQKSFEIKKFGVYNIAESENGSIPGDLAQASAIALSAAVDLKANEVTKSEKTTAPAENRVFSRIGLQNTASGNRTGVFLCRCGVSISSIIDFKRVAQEIAALPDVCSIHELAQSCTGEGAKIIRDYVEKEQIDHVVLAACRCCNLEQICFSCTDRRVMCQNNLSVELPPGVNIEFSNIREQCAWIHKDDPEGATESAIELIRTGVARAQKLVPVIHTPRPVINSVLIIGTGLSGLASARTFKDQGYEVTFIFESDASKSKAQSPEYRRNVNKILKQLEQQGLRIKPWPQSLELNGSPGKFEAVISYGSRTERIEIGAVILDLMSAGKETMEVLANSNLLRRAMSRQNHSSRVSSLDATILHSYTERETAGIFIILPVGTLSIQEQITLGEATAARASVYLNQETFQPRSSSVVINPKLCRGCADCARICAYVEMKTNSQGVTCAYVDPALCFGCGACISVCPTGAITQPLQTEIGITAALKSLLKKEERVVPGS